MHRINIFTALFIVLCSGLIQAGSFTYISILGTKPDMLFVITAFLSLCAAPPDAVKTAAVCGFIKDLTSQTIFGSYTVSFIAVSLFLNQNQNKFFRERISAQFLIVFTAYLASNFLTVLFNAISYKAQIPYGIFLAIALKGALYTAFISPFLFFLLSKVLRIDLAPA
jgi:rod shape-determining protein MreD